jgi:prepilin-type processing-associated H-X9-DG protein
MYNAYNFSFGAIPGNASAPEMGNTTVAISKLNILTCPSDDLSGSPLRQLLTTGLYYGTTNYYGNWGGPPTFQPFSGTIVPGNNHWYQTCASGTQIVSGSFGPIRIASITDGTSNTGLVSEHLTGTSNVNFVRNSNLWKRGEWHSPYTGATVGSGPNTALLYIQGCNSVPGTTANRYGGVAGQLWVGAFPLYMIVNSYNHWGTPNTIACTNPAEPTYPGGFSDANGLYYGGPLGSVPPNSNHSGGVNVGFSDGSVRFIKDNVNPQAWWALGSRNGGEVVSADAF